MPPRGTDIYLTPADKRTPEIRELRIAAGMIRADMFWLSEKSKGYAKQIKDKEAEIEAIQRKIADALVSRRK